MMRLLFRCFLPRRYSVLSRPTLGRRAFKKESKAKGTPTLAWKDTVHSGAQWGGFGARGDLAVTGGGICYNYTWQGRGDIKQVWGCTGMRGLSHQPAAASTVRWVAAVVPWKYPACKHFVTAPFPLDVRALHETLRLSIGHTDSIQVLVRSKHVSYKIRTQNVMEVHPNFS